MNVQLYAYEGTTRYELDLYEEQPIKITLSAEEITDPTQINSSFSRQFRIPATNNNSKFFKYWYTSGVIDFDVTKKVRADIYVDGIKYTNGQLRLVAAYDNGTSDRIDFEVVFLGETKTFSSQVGDGYMNSIDCTDAAHVLTLPWLENTWNEVWDPTITYQVGQYVWWSAAAYNDPTIGDSYKALAVNTNSEPSLSNSNWQRMTTTQRVGNPEPVRYILADRGYNYDDSTGNQLAVPGANAVSEVAVDNSEISGAGTHNDAFTKSVHPLYLTQFTPIIQCKYLVDKIFQQTDYRYTPDSVFNDAWFKKLYIDGIATGFPYTPNGNALFFAETAYYSPVDNGEPVQYDTVLQNNANAYNATTYTFVVPANGSYSFEASVAGYASNDGDQGQPSPYAECAIYRNGSALFTPITETGIQEELLFSFTTFELNYTGNFNAGDEITVILNIYNNDFAPYVSNGTFACTSSPSQIAVNDLLKDNLKIIDWFKSLLTKFRLVMVPTIDDPNLFVIKPWQDYIGSGETYDWTYKLDHNKDIKMEPLFYSQSGDITFADQEDIDVVNTYQQDTFGQVYGTRQFVSGNELLSGTKDITTEFAPTPVAQIEGLFQFNTQFIIPKLYENGDQLTDHGHLQHLPIVPQQRLLYWNGLQPTTTDVNGTPTQVTWHYTDNTTTKNSNQEPLLYQGFRRYPRASYLSEIPTTSTTLNLNWKKQFPYFSYPGAPGNIGQQGEDVYQRYWKSYIDNIYSPQARKMTAYFNLNSEDMRQLTFDDLIWIKDTYWRIQKVYDAPLGEVATVKVELIKLLDYVRPIAVAVNNPDDFVDTVDVNAGDASNYYSVQQQAQWDQQAVETGTNPEDIQPAP